MAPVKVEVGAEYEEFIYRGPICYHVTRRYNDRLSGDEMLSRYVTEPERRQALTMDGMVLEVGAKMVGCNTLRPFWERDGADDGEGTPVVNVVHKAKLVPVPRLPEVLLRRILLVYGVRLIRVLVAKGEIGKAGGFKEKIREFTDYVVSNLEDIDLYMGKRAWANSWKGSLVFVHFKNGRDKDPTVLYLAHGLDTEDTLSHFSYLDKPLEEDMDSAADESSPEDVYSTTPSTDESPSDE